MWLPCALMALLAALLAAACPPCTRAAPIASHTLLAVQAAPPPRPRPESDKALCRGQGPIPELDKALLDALPAWIRVGQGPVP